MKRILDAITGFSSDKKGAKIVLLAWILVATALSLFAPGTSEFSENTNKTGLPEDSQYSEAQEIASEYFGSSGTPGILVFYNESGITEGEIQSIKGFSQKIIEKQDNELANVKEMIPFSKLPQPAAASFISENQTTLFLPIVLQGDLRTEELKSTLEKIEKLSSTVIESDQLQLTITGPAGIAVDSTALFKNADVVLILSTVALIFVLLIVIYRSPILAIIPLIAAGIVYMVADRVLGILGSYGLNMDTQSISIMSILLFAALTDYSLFIIARFREELHKRENKNIAMRTGMKQVGVPIFFSGATVIGAMLVLLFAIFQTYHDFGPIFAVAMVIILTAGLTLLPAMFVLVGRKSFWPIIPKVEAIQKEKGIWWKIAHFVTRFPALLGGTILIFLTIAALNIGNISYTFNLLKSFPEDLPSRVGFEHLEENFAPGELAPTPVIVHTDDGKIDVEKLANLKENLNEKEGVAKVTPTLEKQQPAMPATYLSDNGKYAKLELVFSSNPYEAQAINNLEDILLNKEELLQSSGFENASIYFAGETAKQLDTREINNRDLIVVASIVTVLITIMLGFQTGSLIAPIYMILTILISYLSALGLSTFIFENFMGYYDMSYSIPLYTFVFLVALGVDYNIMLMSRIREYVDDYPIKEAVFKGLAHTGGVISSAGLVLAATFAVLMTQPLLLLYMFGFTVAVGIMIDTFLVRSILLPAIVMKLGKYSFWPYKPKYEAKQKAQD
ncbi:MMPL family transporter [Virgibacillus necropolis]|uniref:MMPL family transporter n=1 Tax=Virgibacillus necropolis TaxID=163877 RepID=UPI003850808C